MITPSRFRISLVVPLLAFLSACSPKQSPETLRYLQKLTASVDQYDNALSALAQGAAPKAPEMPKFSAELTEPEEKVFERYAADMAVYYTAIEEISRS